ncbi:MAG TPA: hypothetical protein VGJ91_18860 [Polyangiaceae bacterium]
MSVRAKSIGRNKPAVVGLIVAWCASAVGCSGSDVSASTLSDRYEQLELEISGGYGPEPCNDGKNSFEVTRVPGHLTWTGCDNSVSPAEPVTGERGLSDAEIESVTKAFAKIWPSSAQNCDADARVWTLDVTTSSGVKRYTDNSSSACPSEAQAGRSFVTGMGYLANLLVELVQQ